MAHPAVAKEDVCGWSLVLNDCVMGPSCCDTKVDPATMWGATMPTTELGGLGMTGHPTYRQVADKMNLARIDVPELSGCPDQKTAHV